MPVVDQIAAEYQGEVEFVAVAGRSDLGATTAQAGRLLSDNVKWGLDESVWDLYGARYQPITVAIGADGLIAETWYGVIGASEMRLVIDGLLAEA